MNIIEKRQLRTDQKMLERLIKRYGGEVTLITAHDHVAVALDLYRGAGQLKRKRSRKSNFEKGEYQTWTC